MLMRFDPFRELDRLTDQGWRGGRLPVMPLDAYRHGDVFTGDFDLPGVDPASIDLTIERNVLTVSAERTWQHQEGVDVVAAERPQGRFSRQLFLGDGLDATNVEANYVNGVLTVRLPVAEQAKPRKVTIGAGSDDGTAITASPSTSTSTN
jgi:HSP20 family protein